MTADQAAEKMSEGFLVKAIPWATGYYLQKNEFGLIINECGNRESMVDAEYKVCGYKVKVDEKIDEALQKVKEQTDTGDKVFLLIEV